MKKNYQKNDAIIKPNNNPKDKYLIPEKKTRYKFFLSFALGNTIGIFVLIIFSASFFVSKYNQRIYPGIILDGVDFGGKDRILVENYFQKKSEALKNTKIIFLSDQLTSTVSASDFDFSYDGKLVSRQAYLLGRSGNFFSDLSEILNAFKNGIRLSVPFYFNDRILDQELNGLSQKISYPAQNALFKFAGGRVVSFKTAKNGLRLNVLESKRNLYKILSEINRQKIPEEIPVNLVLETVKPKINVNQSNDFGIEELIGSGTSTFYHSILNRVYNIKLATSRINGVLIPPNKEFSFNDALGDVSGLTGYKTAYIIKGGKTVLGDGGGVCQVSTTLFRAALNTGLPVTERWPHSYRVGYYEQDELPGLDATVYAPNNDLKIKNDTSSHILIQALFDEENYRLTFYLYGKRDGRKISLTKPKIWDITQAPPGLYQDDPNLPLGEVQQIDFPAPGTKSSFDYQVTKNGNIIFNKTFYSAYQPWQAVYLRGIKPL